MRIEVRLFTTLAAYLPPGGGRNPEEIDVPEGTTLIDVIRLLEIPAESPKLLFVNNRQYFPRWGEGEEDRHERNL
jgi:hypothetical protein